MWLGESLLHLPVMLTGTVKVSVPHQAPVPPAASLIARFQPVCHL